MIADTVVTIGFLIVNRRKTLIRSFLRGARIGIIDITQVLILESGVAFANRVIRYQGEYVIGRNDHHFFLQPFVILVATIAFVQTGLQLICTSFRRSDIKDLTITQRRFRQGSQVLLDIRSSFGSSRSYIIISTHVTGYLTALGITGSTRVFHRRKTRSRTDHKVLFFSCRFEIVVSGMNITNHIPLAARRRVSRTVNRHKILIAVVIRLACIRPSAIILQVLVLIISLIDEPTVIAPVVTVKRQRQVIFRNGINNIRPLGCALQTVHYIPLMIEGVYLRRSTGCLYRF